MKIVIDFILLASLVLVYNINGSPITNPLKEDGDINNILPDYLEVKRTKSYHNITPVSIHGIDEVNLKKHSHCLIDFHLRWSTKVSGSVFSSPVIFPTGAEGKKSIFLSVFYQFIEVLGYDGFKPWGWPISFEESSFHGSPMLYDIDGDGTSDIGVVDKNANLFWIRLGDFGQYLEDYHIQVPKLKIKRDWSAGMDPKFVDAYVMLSMFDHKTELEADASKGKKEPKARPDRLGVPVKLKPEAVPPKEKAGSSVKEQKNDQGKSVPTSMGRKLFSIEDENDINQVKEGDTAISNQDENNIKLDEQSNQDASPHTPVDVAKEGIPVPPEHTTEQHIPSDHHVIPPEHTTEQHIPSDHHVVTPEHTTEQHIPSDHHAVPPEHTTEQHIPSDHHAVPPEHTTELHIPSDHHAVPPEHASEQHLVADKLPSSEELSDSLTEEQLIEEGMNPEDEEHIDPVTDDVISQRAYMYAPRGGYRMDDMHPYYFGMANDSHFVFVDPHVLGSPVLADINHDGHLEVIMAVSYYFDKADYAGKELDFDPSQFVGGGIVCWDVEAEDWSWMVHLDLTTDKTKFTALIHSTPTVADLDGDGRSEIIIGTSLGLLYVLDGESGFARRFFPMQFHQIQAQVAVADIMDGPDLEIIVADMGGTLACVSVNGDILWDIQLSGSLPFCPTIGDVNGDGVLDVVVVTSADATHHSHIWAVDGTKGTVLEGYPVALPDKSSVSGSVLLVDLHDYYSHSKSMTPAKFADPILPPWLQMSRGHEPAPSPSMKAEEHHEKRKIEKEREANYTQNQLDPDEIDLSLSSVGEGLPLEFRHHSKAHRHFNPHRPKALGLHLIVPSFDGHIYVIDGVDKCAQRIDVGEHMYSTPLMDDITGDGFLDLLVGTMNGQVMVMETSIPYHPLNAWSSFPKGRLNGFVHGQMGISVPAIEKRRLMKTDILKRSAMGGSSSTSGEADDAGTGSGHLHITFDIWDSRRKHDGQSYVVFFTRGTNRAHPIAKYKYTSPGRYTVALPLTPPESTLLVLTLINEHGQQFEDTVPVSIGMRFYVWIKFFIVGPILALCVPLLLMRPKRVY